jgi:putative Mn2+ efflux pump MntP
MNVVLYGVLSGLDNLVVSSGYSVLELSRKRCAWLVAMFGLFEAIMPVIGSLLGQELRGTTAEVAEWLSPIFVGLCGLLVLLGVWKAPQALRAVNNRGMVFLLPLVMSLDNLSAGVALGATGVPWSAIALVTGGISACMALIGVCIGQFLRDRMPRRAPFIAGVWLCFFVVLSALRETP